MTDHQDAKILQLPRGPAPVSVAPGSLLLERRTCSVCGTSFRVPIASREQMCQGCENAQRQRQGRRRRYRHFENA